MGGIALALGATDDRTRIKLEDLVARVFLSSVDATDPLYPDPGRDMRPGVLLIDAPDCYGARMAFVLESAEWDSEKVFSEEWYTTLRVTAELPALVPRYKVNVVSDLRLYFTESLETQVALEPLPSDVQKVRINLDGTATVLP